MTDISKYKSIAIDHDCYQMRNVEDRRTPQTHWPCPAQMRPEAGSTQLLSSSWFNVRASAYIQNKN